MNTAVPQDATPASPHMTNPYAIGVMAPPPMKPSGFKTMLRPALGWLFIVVVIVALALCAVSVVTDRAHLTEATPVLMAIIGVLGTAVTTWVYSRGKEKIAGKEEGITANVGQDNFGGASNYGN